MTSWSLWEIASVSFAGIILLSPRRAPSIARNIGYSIGASLRLLQSGHASLTSSFADAIRRIAQQPQGFNKTKYSILSPPTLPDSMIQQLLDTIEPLGQNPMNSTTQTKIPEIFTDSDYLGILESFSTSHVK